MFRRAFTRLSLTPSQKSMYEFTFEHQNKKHVYPLKKEYPVEMLFQKLKMDHILSDGQVYLADSKTILSRLTSLEFLLKECIQEGGFYIKSDGMSFCTLPSIDQLKAPVQSRINTIDKELMPLEAEYDRIASASRRQANKMIWAGLVGLSTQFVVMARLTFWDLSWDVMEPVIDADVDCLFLRIRKCDICVFIFCLVQERIHI